MAQIKELDLEVLTDLEIKEIFWDKLFVPESIKHIYSDKLRGRILSILQRIIIKRFLKH